MTRLVAVKKAAYAADGFRCCVCGFDGRDLEDRLTLSPHHDKRLGMGGSSERDNLANVITLCKGPNSCHDRETRGLLLIKEFDRETGSMNVWERDNVQDDWQRILPSELWFHRARCKQEAEEALTRLHVVQTIDAAVCRDLYMLRLGYKEIAPEARSFPEFASGYGWRPNDANQGADAYEYIEEHGFEWPTGVNFRKVLLIADAEPERHSLWIGPEGQKWDAQKLLHDAVSSSYSKMREDLCVAGLHKGAWSTFLLFPAHLAIGVVGDEVRDKVRIVRARRLGAVIERAQELPSGANLIIVEVRAFRKGLKWTKRGGGQLLNHLEEEVEHAIWD